MIDSVKALQEQAVRYAAEKSPYYRRLFAGWPSLPALAESPFLEKKILSEYNLDFLCVPMARVVDIVTTSGTSGQPLQWMLSESDLRRLARNEQLSFSCAGLAAGDTVLVAVAMDRCFMAGLAYWLGLRELGCAAVRTGAGSPLFVLEMIERTRPSAIVAVPSFLRLVAEKARETGFDLKGCSVKKMICIGEPVRQQDFSLNAAGRLIAEAWQAEVYATYGVTELSNSLCECAAGQGGHLHEDQLYLEILNDAGHEVAEGEIGEIVATTFGVEAMPLLRYRTGDCTAMWRSPCPCGRTSPRVGPIVGRKQQKLKIKGTSIFPSMLTTVLEETPEVDAFVVVARAQSDQTDALEVYIHGGVSIPALREALQARTRLALEIRQASRAEIEAMQLPPQARKRQVFIDLR